MDERRAGEAMAALHAAMRAESAGDLALASHRGEDAMRGFDAAGDPTGAAAARQFLGNLRFGLGDAVSAIGLLHQALGLRSHTGDFAGQASILQDLLAMALRVGDLESARAVAERCIEVQQRGSNRDGQVEARLQVAEVALQQGDAGAAGAQALAALSLLDRPADAATRAHIYAVQARVALAEGAHEAAENLGKQAVEAGEQAKSRPAVVDGREVLADVAMARQNPAEAARLLTAVLEVRLLIRDPFATAASLHRLGAAQAALGQWQAASEHLLHAASEYARAGEAEAAVGACQTLGRLLDDAGQPDGAIDAGNQAIEHARASGEPLVAAWQDQARRLASAGRIEAAVAVLREALAIADAIPELRDSTSAMLDDLVRRGG
jgi:tetratricopeptide (TPR) repeat protein